MFGHLHSSKLAHPALTKLNFHSLIGAKGNTDVRYIPYFQAVVFPKGVENGDVLLIQFVPQISL